MGSMRSMCACTLGLLLGVGAELTGCASSAANPPATPATAATAEDEVAADLSEHHRHHHHGGITKFISMSLDSLGVSPEQSEAVRKIQADLEAKMDRARAAEQSVVLALADGIAAGSVDHARVDAALAQVAGAAGALHDATADSLNQLHAILTPAERAALVDKVEAHWDVWKRANAVGDQASDGTFPVSPERGRDDAKAASGGHLAILAGELNLTPEQVERIHSNLAKEVKPPLSRLDPQEIEACLQAFGAAFKADTFDARTLRQVSSANEQLAGWGAARMAHFYEAAAPALTPDQRTSLAEMLREHANHANAG
jgi:Spy/CpxP family protein refolding chaperone